MRRRNALAAHIEGLVPAHIVRMVLVALLGLVGAFVLLVIVLGRVFSGPAYHGPVSDHFDGTRFLNEATTYHGGVRDVARWMVTRRPGPWRPWTPSEPGAPPPHRVGAGELRVTFVGHATTLIQMDGLNVLTDPVWATRASPVQWAGPRRARPPGIRYEDLPPIDVVLLSHNHYDHFDLVTLLRLHRDHRPRFLAGLGNAAFLARRGVHATTELDWWESTDLASGVRLTAVPAKHFSGRGTFDRDRTLWAGYVVTGPAGAVYFAGDTGFGGHFQEIHERFPSIRLAVLPIGAFRPEWFMSRVHVSPDQALRAHGIVRAGTSVAIHFGTFHLADDGQDEAPDRLRELLAQAPEPRPRFWVLGFGEGRAVPEAEAAG